MLELSLDAYQSAGVGAVVLIAGFFLVKHSPLLRKYCIPAAVIGGLVFSLIMLVTYEADILEVTFDNTFSDLCMRVFFCSVGFLASFSMLRSGGRILTVMVVMIIVLVTLQNVIGVTAVSLFGQDPKYGLALGSISLCGGHGTAAAYGSLLVEEYGLVGADVVAIASATFGLAIAGFMGGPLAGQLIKRNGLHPESVTLESTEEKEQPIVNERFLKALILIVVCMGAGTFVNAGLDGVGITVPGYFGALVVAIIVRNVADLSGYEVPEKEIEVVGWICLCVFLAMALMAMKLWQLASLAATMIVTLLIQTVVLAAFVYYVVFRLTGRNYESAALCTGTVGFGMGATPNAVANVEALMLEHGPAPMAYFMIPILGGVFMDIINVSILTVFLNVL